MIDGTPVTPPPPLTPETSHYPPPRRHLDSNTIGFLLSGSDPKALSNDFDTIIDRARKSVETYLGSPEGQQIAHSMARANIGTSDDVPMLSHPVPKDVLRYYVPMLPMDVLEDLNDILVPLTNDFLANVTDAQQFRAFFESTLAAKLDALNIPRTDDVVQHARLLLNPAVTLPRIGGSATDYMKLAAHYADSKDTHFPLVTASTDSRIANAVGQSLLETIANRRGVSVAEVGKLDVRTSDVSGKEFFNSEGGVREVEQVGPETFGSTYYGYGPDGVMPAAAFGKGGLKNNKVFGIGAHALAPQRMLRRVPIVKGQPQTKRLSIYGRTQDNEPRAVVRTGSEMEETHYANSPDWELQEEQFVTGDDLFDFIREQAILTTEDMAEVLTNASRAGSNEQLEVFYPWAREINDSEISPHRIMSSAIHRSKGTWFRDAPKQIHGWTPTIEEGFSPAAAFSNLMRHWFDGTISPMLGAMVREPLFLHYLTKAWKQTEGMRSFHFHRKADVHKFKHLGQFDDDGQLVSDVVEDFIMFDWATAHLDLTDGGAPTALARLVWNLEQKDRDGVKTAIDDLTDIFLEQEGRTDLAGQIPLTQKQIDFWQNFGDLGDNLDDAIDWVNGR